MASWPVAAACRPRAKVETPASAVVASPAPKVAAASPTWRFDHGVASGDPLQQRVIIWTRISGGFRHRAHVKWRVFELERSDRTVRQGEFETGPWRDYTVKVDVEGLRPGRRYAYEFEVDGVVSPRGRTRTLPALRPERVRLAVCSCSNLPAGFFNAYAHMAANDELDAVVHLGDYIYELADGQYGDGAKLGRYPEPRGELLQLADYRARYASYRVDPDLQAVHAAHPFIVVWDDHEFANNAYWRGAQNHQPGPDREGIWALRRMAALQAHGEWMPVRDIFLDARPVIFRAVSFGGLVDLMMLDTRLRGREKGPRRDDLESVGRPRALIDAAQRGWLQHVLEHSTATWRVLGQQVMLAPLVDARTGAPTLLDTWNGYPAEQQWLLGALRRYGGGNNIVLTGDVHSSWANALTDAPADAPAVGSAQFVGAEFVCPAISSPGLSGKYWAHKLREFMAANPAMQWAEWSRQGYVEVEFDSQASTATWWHVDTVLRRDARAQVAKRFVLPVDARELQATS